jgi:hypothetical protein
MGAPQPMMGPDLGQMVLKAAASALAGALQNLSNPAGARAVTQTYLPVPPTLDPEYNV